MESFLPFNGSATREPKKSKKKKKRIKKLQSNIIFKMVYSYVGVMTHGAGASNKPNREKQETTNSKLNFVWYKK